MRNLYDTAYEERQSMTEAEQRYASEEQYAADIGLRKKEFWTGGRITAAMVIGLLSFVFGFGGFIFTLARAAGRNCPVWDVFTGENHHYKMHARCGNCNRRLVVWIPEGTPRAGFAWDAVCDNCGLENVGVLRGDSRQRRQDADDTTKSDVHPQRVPFDL